MSNLASFLQTLNQYSEKNSFSVYIPSLKKEVIFKPLTTKQQKLFYACMIDNAIFKTKFITTTFEIIKDLCTEPECLKKLNIIDRLIILLALRQNTLGSFVSVLKDDTVYEADFTQALQKASTLIIPENEVLHFKNIKVELQVPLIIDQYNLEKEARGSTTLEIEDITEISGEVLINELCKYIKEVSVLDEERSLNLNYAKLSYKERLVVVENLPAEVLLNIRPFTEKIANTIKDILTLKVNENVSIAFDLDVDFFLDS